MRARIHQTSLSLRRRFSTSGWSVGARDVIFIRLTDERSGLSGKGEAAPLEAFGTESYDRSLAVLQHIAPAIESVPRSPEDIMEFLGAYPELDTAQCARFGLETALLDVLALREGVPMYRLFGGPVCDGFPVNAVVGRGTIDEIRAMSRSARASGYPAIKLKVGQARLSADVRRVVAARETVGPDMLIRLDANGAWDRERALEAIAHFEPQRIEFIEQPVPKDDLGGMREVAARSRIPVAADESLRDLRNAAACIADDIADVYVLKPMALGSLIACRALAGEAVARGKGIVVTSLLDSAVGRRAAAHLIASLPAVWDRCHGLGTGDLFTNDMAVDPIAHGRYSMPDIPGLGVEIRP